MSDPSNAEAAVAWLLERGPITETPAWAALAAHYEAVTAEGGLNMRDVFAADPDRFNKLSVRRNAPPFLCERMRGRTFFFF